MGHCADGKEGSVYRLAARPIELEASKCAARISQYFLDTTWASASAARRKTRADGVHVVNRKPNLPADLPLKATVHARHEIAALYEATVSLGVDMVGLDGEIAEFMERVRVRSLARLHKLEARLAHEGGVPHWVMSERVVSVDYGVENVPDKIPGLDVSDARARARAAAAANLGGLSRDGKQAGSPTAAAGAAAAAIGSTPSRATAAGTGPAPATPSAGRTASAGSRVAAIRGSRSSESEGTGSLSTEATWPRPGQSHEQAIAQARRALQPAPSSAMASPPVAGVTGESASYGASSEPKQAHAHMRERERRGTNAVAVMGGSTFSCVVVELCICHALPVSLGPQVSPTDLAVVLTERVAFNEKIKKLFLSSTKPKLWLLPQRTLVHIRSVFMDVSLESSLPPGELDLAGCTVFFERLGAAQPGVFARILTAAGKAPDELVTWHTCEHWLSFLAIAALSEARALELYSLLRENHRVKRGVLLKKVGFLKRWKPRWYKLSLDDGMLTQYPTAEYEYGDGAASVKRYSLLQYARAEPCRASGASHTLTLIPRGAQLKPFVFATNTAAELADWLDTINGVLQTNSLYNSHTLHAKIIECCLTVTTQHDAAAAATPSPTGSQRTSLDGGGASSSDFAHLPVPLTASAGTAPVDSASPSSPSPLRGGSLLSISVEAAEHASSVGTSPSSSAAALRRVKSVSEHLAAMANPDEAPAPSQLHLEDDTDVDPSVTNVLDSAMASAVFVAQGRSDGEEVGEATLTVPRSGADEACVDADALPSFASPPGSPRETGADGTVSFPGTGAEARVVGEGELDALLELMFCL